MTEPRASVQDLREASAAELADWDEHTVRVRDGHVYQSRTWGEYRQRNGWRSIYLVFGDDFRLLVAQRPWPLVGGAGAYIPRGPVAAGAPAALIADRLGAAARWLADRGVDVISSDAEIPTDTGYPALLEARGFRQIEEVTPSRHRMALALDPAGDAAVIFEGFSKSLRQTIRTAARKGLKLSLYDAPAAAPIEDVPGLTRLSTDAAGPLLERHYALVIQTGERRHFPVPPRSQFIDSSGHALSAGLAIAIEALTPDGDVIASSLFYRHGTRFTYASSADSLDDRRSYPGVVQLILWQAIQLAIAEGRDEFDLGGVDVPGARERPRPSDEMYGLYAMKERFGGRWVELTGNHEWVARPWRYTAGRATARIQRLLRSGR